MSSIWFATRWTALLNIARDVHPGAGLRIWARRVQFVITGLRERAALARLLAQPRYAHFAKLLQSEPGKLAYMQWPYINKDWRPLQRFEVMAQHEAVLAGDCQALQFPAGGQLVVAQFEEVAPGLRLELDRAQWFMREGSLALNLFLGEHRLMSLAFAFAQRADGKRVAYVGCLQGTNTDTALDIYRDLTKAMHGLRPRDFVIKAFQIFAQQCGATELLCVDEAHRHHRADFFGGKKEDDLHMSYDPIWVEQGGVAVEGGFFKLSVVPRAKPLEDIASKKRAMYRRRYEMLESLTPQFATVLRSGQLPTPPTARRLEPPADSMPPHA